MPVCGTLAHPGCCRSPARGLCQREGKGAILLQPLSEMFAHKAWMLQLLSSLSHLNLCDSAQASINLLIFFLCLAVGGFRRPAASDKSEGQACFRYLAWGTSLAVGTSLPGPSQQLVTK